MPNGFLPSAHRRADERHPRRATGDCRARIGRESSVDVLVAADASERRFDDDRLSLYGMGEEDGVYDERSTGAVVSRLIRESSCVLELPVVGAGCLARHLDADGECRCRDIIRAIADCDALICEDAHTVSLMELVGAASGATVPRV